MQQDDDLRSFFQTIASTQPTARLSRDPPDVVSQSPAYENSDVSGASGSEDSGPHPRSRSSASQSTSESSSPDQEMSNEWMFEGKVCFRIHDVGSKVYHKDLGNLFKEEFSPRAPATPDYIVVLGNLNEQEKDSDGVIRMPIRGYFAAKRTSRKSCHQWIPQPDFTWTKVTGGMLTFPQFLEDRDIIGANNGPWYELVHWGRRHFFETQGRSWAFDGSLTVQPKTPSDCKDFLERARDAFLESAGTSDDWPSGIKFLLVMCDIAALVGADEAHEVDVDVKGFSKPLGCLSPVPMIGP